MFIVITQDVQPTKIILNNKVSTNASKKTISHRGATLWANVEQNFNDKSHNVFNKQEQSFLLLQYE